MCSYFFIYTVQHVSIRFSVTLNQTYKCANTNDLKTNQKCSSRPQNVSIVLVICVNCFLFILCQLFGGECKEMLRWHLERRVTRHGALDGRSSICTNLQFKMHKCIIQSVNGRSSICLYNTDIVENVKLKS